MALPRPFNPRVSLAAAYQTPGAGGVARAASQNGLQRSVIVLYSVMSPVNAKVP